MWIVYNRLLVGDNELLDIGLRLPPGAGQAEPDDRHTVCGDGPTLPVLSYHASAHFLVPCHLCVYGHLPSCVPAIGVR